MFDLIGFGFGNKQMSKANSVGGDFFGKTAMIGLEYKWQYMRLHQMKTLRTVTEHLLKRASQKALVVN